MALGPLRPYADMIRLALWIGLALAIAGAGFYGGLRWSAGEVAEVEARAEKIVAEFARAEAAAVARARAAEQLDAERKHAAGEAYERGKADAKTAADRTITDLRAGNLKLRNHWAGCETDRLSSAAADAGQPDADAELRYAGAGDLVRLLDQCDAWIGSLQQVAP